MNQDQKTEIHNDLLVFRRRLIGLAGDRGLSQVRIAELLHVAPSRVGQWFQGKNKPQREIAAALAGLLRVSTEWLLHGVDETDNSVFLPPSEMSHVAEVMPPIDYMDDMKRKLRSQFDALLMLAANDPAKLGWVHEQMELHLKAPAHWKIKTTYTSRWTDAVERGRSRAAAEIKKESGRHPDVSPGEKSG